MSEDLTELTKEELKDQAREAGVPVSGTKDELIERLEELDSGGGNGPLSQDEWDALSDHDKQRHIAQGGRVEPATAGVTKTPDPNPDGTYPNVEASTAQ